MRRYCSVWIRQGLGVLAVMVSFGAATVLHAKIYEVAAEGSTPQTGIWPSVGALLEAGVVSAGDEIHLADGTHGEIKLRNMQFNSPVIIRPAAGAEARLTGLNISKSRNLIFEGLQIWSDTPQEKGHLIITASDTHNLVLRNLDVRGRANANDYRNWSRETWNATKRAGILLRGTQSAVLDSSFTGVAAGIGVIGEGARIEGNVIRGFSRDGINITGDNVTVRGNRVEDCVKISENHDDGIQAWSLGPDGKPGRGTLKNLRIENNVVMEWRGSNAPALTCDLQGIGLFDGMYQGISITNNLVMVSAYHGIAVNGGINSVITHNTVLHRTDGGQNHPWIGVFTHKDKRPSRRMVVANNIAPKFNIAGDTQALTDTQNLTERYPARRLEAPYAGDFTPKADSGMLGAASLTHAAQRDVFGRARGNRPDLGAVQRP